MISDHGFNLVFGTHLTQKIEFRLRVRTEPVDRDDQRHTVASQVFDVSAEVSGPGISASGFSCARRSRAAPPRIFKARTVATRTRRHSQSQARPHQTPSNFLTISRGASGTAATE
jgi:hypothetical protein